MKLTMEAVCEMSLYSSLSHYLARKLSPERLATLSSTERAARTRAQKQLSQRRRRTRAEQFFTAAVEPTPTRSPHRDYLFDPKGRDILRP